MICWLMNVVYKMLPVNCIKASSHNTSCARQESRTRQSWNWRINWILSNSNVTTEPSYSNTSTRHSHTLSLKRTGGGGRDGGERMRELTRESYLAGVGDDKAGLG